MGLMGLKSAFHLSPDHHGSGPPPHKKKRKSLDHSPSLSSSSSSQPPHSTDTAMGLLQAITSPMATGSDPSPHLHKKPAYPPLSSHSSPKDRKREGSSKTSHSSFSHSRPPGTSSLLPKKHSSSSSSSSSKSSLFHGGAGRGEPLTLREAEGLKMKLILSPKERNEGGGNEGFPFPPHSTSTSGNTGHHSSSIVKKAGMKKEKEKDRLTSSKPPKKKQHSREPLPVVGKEVEVEGWAHPCELSLMQHKTVVFLFIRKKWLLSSSLVWGRLVAVVLDGLCALFNISLLYVAISDTTRATIHIAVIHKTGLDPILLYLWLLFLLCFPLCFWCICHCVFAPTKPPVVWTLECFFSFSFIDHSHAVSWTTLTNIQIFVWLVSTSVFSYFCFKAPVPN